MDESSSKSNDCVLVAEGTMKGANILVDNETSEVVQLSTKDCADEDRWTVMPSVEGYPALQVVDLHNSRYITELHESITGLSQLKKLALTRCVSLERLPPGLGRLQHLQDVRLYSFLFCSKTYGLPRLPSDTFVRMHPPTAGYDGLTQHFRTTGFYW